MRLRSDLLIIFLLSLMPAWGQRIMSYNIQHGHGMDDQVNLERTAELIRSENLDIVALQESNLHLFHKDVASINTISSNGSVITVIL